MSRGLTRPQSPAAPSRPPAAARQRRAAPSHSSSRRSCVDPPPAAPAPPADSPPRDDTATRQAAPPPLCPTDPPSPPPHPTASAVGRPAIAARAARLEGSGMAASQSPSPSSRRMRRGAATPVQPVYESRDASPPEGGAGRAPSPGQGGPNGTGPYRPAQPAPNMAAPRVAPGGVSGVPASAEGADRRVKDKVRRRRVAARAAGGTFHKAHPHARRPNHRSHLIPSPPPAPHHARPAPPPHPTKVFPPPPARTRPPPPPGPVTTQAE